MQHAFTVERMGSVCLSSCSRLLVAFVLISSTDGELQYRGRLDDKAMGDPTDRVGELVDAMMLVAETGKGPREQKPSIGCSIKWV